MNIRSVSTTLVLFLALLVSSCNYDKGVEDGKEIGRKEGLADGYKDGRADGVVEGKEEGRKEGEAVGYIKGTSVFVGESIVPSLGLSVCLALSFGFLKVFGPPLIKFSAFFWGSVLTWLHLYTIKQRYLMLCRDVAMAEEVHEFEYALAAGRDYQALQSKISENKKSEGRLDKALSHEQLFADAVNAYRPVN